MKLNSVKIRVVAGLLLAMGATGVWGEAQKREGKPNFVVILIDDMGYADIEPFGSTLNKTPELNRMAEEGMKLTSVYAAAVCTPSRAALMTGCYSKRVGLAVGSWGRVLFPKDTNGLNPKEKTIAEVLKDAGYSTGCFGKWHLGDQPAFLPTRHGFDTYFGIPYSNDMWPFHSRAKKWKGGCPPLPVLSGEEVVDIVEDPGDQSLLCKRFTDEAVAFIRQNKDRPFFVYLPHAFVHGPRYARKEFMDRASSETKHWRQQLRAQVEEVDWSTGRILDTLRELGLSRNTLVVFVSDNGGTTASSNAPFRGSKGSSWEGGLRVPAIAWWPGTIRGGSSCGEIVTTMDLLPTFAALGGGTVPADRTIDGKNIMPLLLEKAGAESQYKAFFYYQGTRLAAVRSGPWKLFENGQLYNLDKDAGEQQDVSRQYPEVAERLRGLLKQGLADLGSVRQNGMNCRPVGRVEDPRYLEMKRSYE